MQNKIAVNLNIWHKIVKEKKLYNAVNFENEDAEIARIAEEFRGIYKVFLFTKNDCVKRLAEIQGKRMFDAEKRADFPVVGDWVVVEGLKNLHLTIKEILPRTTIFKRKTADEEKEQIIVTNVDLVIVVQPINFKMNIERIKRILMGIKSANAKAILLFSKMDLRTLKSNFISDDFFEIINDLQILEYSIYDQKSIEKIKENLHKGQTVCVVGESGAGKSTLINKLLGEEILRTGSVRLKDSKGRHTTTNRQMVFMKNGVVLIDTPGIREFLWTDEASEIRLKEVNEKVQKLAQECYFANCKHETEPNCAIKKALDEGILQIAEYQLLLEQIKLIQQEKKNKWRLKANDKGQSKRAKKEKNKKGR